MEAVRADLLRVELCNDGNGALNEEVMPERETEQSGLCIIMVHQRFIWGGAPLATILLPLKNIP